MLGKKKSAKTFAARQRTLLELFPRRKIEEPPADSPEEPALDVSSPIDVTCVEPATTQSDLSQGDEPPNSPAIISVPTSTPGSEYNVTQDEEDEQQVEIVNDDREASPLLPGGSQDDPIMIDYSPPKVKVQQDPPKKLWSIFAPRPTQFPKRAQRTSKSTLNAPLPSSEMQHVRGPQAAYSSVSKFPRRSSKANSRTTHDTQSGIRQFLLQEDDNMPGFLEFDIRPCTSEADKAIYLGAIPEEHKRSHPVIKKLASVSIGSNDPPYQLWTEKWRPKLAAEVLGNEKSASYLRDWLRALSLEIGELASPDTGEKGKSKKASKGVKRPRVVRAVDKRERKKRRVDSDDEDDSWIVYNDESEEEIPTENEEEEHHVKLSSNEVNIFEQLANTIILTGPPGSGKTACVYACAEELDWDVFEVYPGIGKRNGASIDNLIGDVGKNHLVRKTAMRPGNADGVSDGYFGFLETARLDNSGSTPRQSFVLLEEVDILFKEDSNFWPAVINFLRDCRRPVICTCNDISLVPLSELPVQNVLAFEPCRPMIAASYLQAVCCSEGWRVDRETLMRLYEVPYETVSDTAQAAPDLRRTMHRLQLWCCASHEAIWGGISHEDPLRRSLPKRCEMLSFLDGEKLVCGTLNETTEPSMDDEVGYTILYEEGAEFDESHVPIISYAMRRARGGDDEKVRWLLEVQGEYEKRIAEGLRGMVPIGVMGKDRMYTEYASYVRQMVEGEDKQEARMAAEGGGGGRSTRNSRRYERVIEAEGRQVEW